MKSNNKTHNFINKLNKVVHKCIDKTKKIYNVTKTEKFKTVKELVKQVGSVLMFTIFVCLKINQTYFAAFLVIVMSLLLWLGQRLQIFDSNTPTAIRTVAAIILLSSTTTAFSVVLILTSVVVVIFRTEKLRPDEIKFSSVLLCINFALWVSTSLKYVI